MSEGRKSETTYTVWTAIYAENGTQRQAFHGCTAEVVDGIRQNVRAITPQGATADVKVVEEQR
jgi:hypothetical protein